MKRIDGDARQDRAKSHQNHADRQKHQWMRKKAAKRPPFTAFLHCFIDSVCHTGPRSCTKA
ncbi:hypothetical protein NRB_02700 [Novosphingobium sp. 11B]